MPSRIFAAVLLVASFFSLPCAAHAQSAPLHFDGGAATLHGPWQFHMGDSTAWASPNYDDSAWEKLSADKPWGAQGHRNQDGFAWYRLRVTLQPGQSPAQLAILIPGVAHAYELYWNGHLVGSDGKLPPNPIWYPSRPQTFGLGPAPAAGQTGVLALRVWRAPFDSSDDGTAGGFLAAPRLGSPRAIAAALAAIDYNWLRSRQLTFALHFLYALVAILSLIAWFRDRSAHVTFWMGCMAISFCTLFVLGGLKLPIPYAIAEGLLQPVYGLQDIAVWYLLLWLLDLRENPLLVRLVRLLAIVDIITTSIDAFFPSGMMLPDRYHSFVYRVDAICTVIETLVELLPLFLVGIAVLRRRRLAPERWLVAAFAFLSQLLFTFQVAVAQGSRFTHWTIASVISTPLLTINGNNVDVQTILAFLLFVSLVFAVYRYAEQDRRRQYLLEEEIRNARAVQQVLIPEDRPETPGFRIESVYHPASEVGGDFFQILPLENNGVLIALGDVSGKGMPAAMTVALLVGTVGTLAQFTQSPAQILAAMNQRMIGRIQGGFTTCLILHAAPSGKITLANAGHLAPYLDSREISLESCLPLGLAAGATYSETTLTLAPGQQLTLLTDGVVEARTQSGELFGFDRTAAISAEPAPKVALAAQAHGQEDDITVLTLALA